MCPKQVIKKTGLLSNCNQSVL